MSKELEIAQGIVADLDQIERQLLELLADARTIRFHRATVRLERMHFIAKSTGVGLRQQIGKMKGRQQP